MPLILNKQKLQHKYGLGQLAGIELTEKQRKLAGINFKPNPKSAPAARGPANLN